MAAAISSIIYALLALFSLSITVKSQQTPLQYTIQNPCTSKQTCHDCIQTPSCAWCFAPDFNSAPRCFQPSFPIPPKDQCPEQYVHNPDNIMGILQNNGLTMSKGHSGGGGGNLWGGWEANGTYSEHDSKKETQWGGGGGAASGSGEGHGITQIKPQRISLKLRARQSYSIQMFYTQAEDYPVDLYYLMDLSKSMEDDKAKLSKLGDYLAQTMQNITTNFTLGFGSFVDKVVMPYVSTIPEKLLQPCTGCVAPYGFRNHMTLSTNTNRFSHMVREASVSGNLDAPEGGFDAIMQAVVCRREIGWREKARRLLVFSTDAGFHYAGDGKLGGIVKPNDGRCHLDNRGYYSMSSQQDYPSVSQINHYVKKNAINVIFAVTADKINVYKQLQSHIEGASYATLSNDSSNIVELIKEQYEQISSTVEMKHNASSAVNIRFFTKCLNKNGDVVETNKCSNIKVGSLVEFRVDLEVTKCPKDRNDWKQTIQIYPVGINESLVIDLEMLCDCPCEHPGNPHYVINSDICRYHGTYQCGVCMCDKGRFGKYCECDENTPISTNDTLNCISPLNHLECSGRGSCLCGRCNCDIRQHANETIFGNFCECDNFSCERHLGELCSGHGDCNCGTCICHEGWSGSNCGCLTSKETCYPPGSDKSQICSGNGVCECGKCVCKVTEDGRYTGKFCEQCPTCPDLCDQFKACVQCQQYKTGPLTDKECSACPFTPIAAKVIEVNETKNEHFCNYYDEDNCRFSFVYYYNNNNTFSVRAEENRRCPPTVFLLGIILGVIAAVVLLGLAIILLWKLLTTIHDRREFAKFEKERMKAKWDTGENPIYKQATSTFKNPTYAGKG